MATEPGLETRASSEGTRASGEGTRASGEGTRASSEGKEGLREDVDETKSGDDPIKTHTATTGHAVATIIGKGTDNKDNKDNKESKVVKGGGDDKDDTKLIADEERAEGTVGLGVYLFYFHHGSYVFVVLTVLFVFGSQISITYSGFQLTDWGTENLKKTLIAQYCSMTGYVQHIQQHIQQHI